MVERVDRGSHEGPNTTVRVITRFQQAIWGQNEILLSRIAAFKALLTAIKSRGKFLQFDSNSGGRVHLFAVYLSFFAPKDV